MKHGWHFHAVEEPGCSRRAELSSKQSCNYPSVQMLFFSGFGGKSLCEAGAREGKEQGREQEGDSEVGGNFFSFLHKEVRKPRISVSCRSFCSNRDVSSGTKLPFLL